MTDAELIHFGIPGMKWGKRKLRTIITTHKARKLKRADAKWEKEALSTDTMVRVNNHAANKINANLESFNKKWGKVNYNDPKLAAYNQRYEEAYGKLWDKHLNDSVNELLKANPSGTKRIKAVTSEPGAFPWLIIVDV